MFEVYFRASFIAKYLGVLDVNRRSLILWSLVLCGKLDHNIFVTRPFENMDFFVNNFNTQSFAFSGGFCLLFFISL